MKNGLKFLFIAAVILGFSANSFGQESTSQTINDAKASATILKALTLSKEGGKDLNFGVIGSPEAAGTVSVGANDDRDASAGIQLYTGFGATASSAVFNIDGTSDNQFSITLPNTDITLSGSGLAMGESMEIKAGTWVTTLGAYPDNKVGTLSGSGKYELGVGATLSVGAGQKPGNYDGTYSVTVVYN